ncbi:MAG: ferrous iron transport protein A [Candidatus Coatesbacteria bacterium]|nr:ferrous iron transport protein A [Candidatus Coatesbacteria bacterium]
MDNKVPLTAVKLGQKVKLRSVNAGQGLKCRLSAMGIVPGAELMVVNTTFAGPMVVMVKDSKVILGRGIAMKMMVE